MARGVFGRYGASGGCSVAVRADATFGGDVGVNVSHLQHDGLHGVARFRVWHPYVVLLQTTASAGLTKCEVPRSTARGSD